MLNDLFKTPLYLSDDEGAPAGAGDTPSESTALPESLKSKYVSVDVFNGTKGNYEQKLKQARSDYEKTVGERSALETQVQALQAQLTEISERAKNADTLQANLTERESGLKSQTDLNARMRSLLKYPQLIDESTLALVESSTLEAPALEETLGKLAEKYKSAVNNGQIHLGESPAAPAKTDAKPEDLILEAEALRRKGDFDGFNKKMRESWALMDAKEKFVPQFQNRTGDMP